MAGYGEGYGDQKHGGDDSYGNKPTRQTDEYGNPIQKGSTGEYGTGGNTGEYGGTGTNTGEYGSGGRTTEEYGSGERTTGEYGSGGLTTGDTEGTYGTQSRGLSTGTHGESKGIGEKIKDKLPGGNKQEEQTYNSSTGTGGAYGSTDTEGYGTGNTGGGYGTGTKTGGEYGSTGTGGYGNEETHEKKGIMDKIKDKLPGQKH